MVNRRRGEVELAIGGRRRRLVFTLGALAELEDAFGAADLAALAERFAAGRLGARDLTRILTAALRGAGEDIDEAGVAALPLAGGVGAVAAACLAALEAAFGETPPDPPAGRR